MDIEGRDGVRYSRHFTHILETTWFILSVVRWPPYESAHNRTNYPFYVSVCDEYNNIINSLNLGPVLININRVLFYYYNKLSDVRPQYLLAFVEQHYLSTAPLIKKPFKVIDLGRRRKMAFSHASTLRRISHRNIVVMKLL